MDYTAGFQSSRLPPEGDISNFNFRRTLEVTVHIKRKGCVCSLFFLVHLQLFGDLGQVVFVSAGEQARSGCHDCNYQP